MMTGKSYCSLVLFESRQNQISLSKFCCRNDLLKDDKCCFVEKKQIENPLFKFCMSKSQCRIYRIFSNEMKMWERRFHRILKNSYSF